jgi:putative hydrolase of the HAD superfamily
MTKTVAFDLGNVLIFFSHPKMVAQIASCTGLSANQIQELLIHNKLRDKYETGLLTSEQIYHQFLQASPKSFTPHEFFLAASNIFTLNKAILPLLQTLKKNKLRLILLSNTSAAHIEFISANYPILHYFDEQVLSYEVKAAKPDPKIFHAAIQAAHCAPSDCFFTDDINENILAARCHGIDAELYTDVSTLTSHLSARQLL